MSDKPLEMPEIDMEMEKILASFPVYLAHLSRLNEDASIRILRKWGTPGRSSTEMCLLWEELKEELLKSGESIRLD